jgi:hypothetical protein
MNEDGPHSSESKPADSGAGASRESYGLESGHETPPAKKKHADLDVCPNCGAPMPEAKQLVCLRCGFDLKTLKVVKTKTGVEEVEPGATPGEPGSVADFSAKGRGGLHLPLALGATAGLVLVIGYLMGVEGLFPEVRAGAQAAAGADGAERAAAGAMSISLGERMLGLLRLVLRSVFWTGAGVAASFVTAHVVGKRLGDLKLAAARLLGIVVFAQLASFLSFSARWIEWMIETAIEVGLFVGLAMFMFALVARDAATLAAMTVATVLVVLGSAHLISWLS